MYRKAVTGTDAMTSRSYASQARRLAWVIGGGSGIGRAAAAALAKRGWTVVISGRRLGPLQATARTLSPEDAEVLAEHCDVSDAQQVASALERIGTQVGLPDTIVCCAGINIPNRHWNELDAASARQVMDVNVGGVLNLMCAAVPLFRQRRRGSFVVVSSWAGWRPTRFTGPAYSASKTALAPLVESINEEEGGAGLRATLVCPGEVNTPILSQRARPPSDGALARMLQPEDVSQAIVFAAEAPPHVCVNEIVISPGWNRIYREPEQLLPSEQIQLHTEDSSA